MTDDGREGLDAGGTNPDPTGNSETDGRASAVFHYNRERRLERAPENVRRAYREGYTPNKGFLKGLTANPGLKSLLTVILILCALVAFLTITDIPGSFKVGGVSMRVRAFAFEDKVYFTLICAKNDASGIESVPVSVTVRILDSDGNALDERNLSGLYTGAELPLRAVLRDESTASVVVDIASGNAKRTMTVTVDRK
jgi:hypothetical protein